jgi:hypothetical protein
LQSQVSFLAEDGVQYYILVSGFGSATGDFELSVTCTPPDPPANDEPAGAIAIDCDDSVVGSNADATQTLAPITCNGELSSAALDVFYSFSADGSTSYTLVEDPSLGDYVIEVLSEDLQTSIACDTWFNIPSTLELGVLDAGTYYIRVYGSDFFASLTSEFAFTLTCESASASLDGSVPNWNNNCAERDVTVQFFQAGSTVLEASYSAVLASDGTFSVPDVATGTFDVFVKIDGYLRDGFASVAIGEGANALEVPSPRLGDLNNDNVVNFFDGSAFNTALTPAPYDPLGDYNCDGAVNFFDVSSLNQTFNQQGDNPPLSADPQ